MAQNHDFSAYFGAPYHGWTPISVPGTNLQGRAQLPQGWRREFESFVLTDALPSIVENLEGSDHDEDAVVLPVKFSDSSKKSGTLLLFRSNRRFMHNNHPLLDLNVELFHAPTPAPGSLTVEGILY